MTFRWVVPCREATLLGLRRPLLLSLPVLLGDCEREYSDLRFFTFGGAPKNFDGVPCLIGPGSTFCGLLPTRLAPELRWREEREDAGEVARLGAGEVLRRLLSSELRSLFSSFDGRPLVPGDNTPCDRKEVKFLTLPGLRCTTYGAVRFSLPGDFERAGEGVARRRSREYGDTLRCGDKRCGSWARPRRRPRVRAGEREDAAREGEAVAGRWRVGVVSRRWVAQLCVGRFPWSTSPRCAIRTRSPISPPGRPRPLAPVCRC